MKELRRLGKLARLDACLRNFAIDDAEVSCHYVTAQDDATSLLAPLAGIHVLAARPELRQTWNDEAAPAGTDVSTVIFVLGKSPGAGNTPKREMEQYDRLEEVADAVLDALFEAVDSCSMCLRLTSIYVRPEVSVFGSWRGWSITLDFC